MKIQIDPNLRKDPFEYAEIFDRSELNDEQKKDCHSLHGYFIKTNIADSERLNTIVANHFMNKAQSNCIHKSHYAALGKGTKQIGILEFAKKYLTDGFMVSPFHTNLIKKLSNE